MSKRYIGPVILAEEMKEPVKVRKVEIFKNEVLKSIDLITHKHVDAREDMGNRACNAVSSDSSEDVDGATLARYIQFRDAMLRDELQFALVDAPAERATDDITLEDNMYRYFFEVPEDFKDSLLRPIAEYIHRFLCFGALYDWYSQFNMNQASVYGAQIEGLLDKISSMLRGSSVAQRPMQPFGPAQKF